MSLKEELIELLGGVTKEEHKKWCEYKYNHGKTFAYKEVLDEMLRIQKLPLEEYRKHMFSFLETSSNVHKEMMKRGQEQLNCLK